MSAAAGDVLSNLNRVRERIRLAAARSGRDVAEITLVAASKTQSAIRIRELFNAGIRHFGENRVQEWESKRESLADLGATWHLIGHLQSNKVVRAARIVQCVDSVDSAAVAGRLDRARADVPMESRLRVLIEVKLDPDPAKSGVAAADLPQIVQAVSAMPNLHLRGVMGVPPFFEDASLARPYFRQLRELRDSLAGGASLPVLSMGMSHDFEVAIEEGATEIRVGTALFGERAGGASQPAGFH